MAALEKEYLLPTSIIDSDHPAVVAVAERALPQNAKTPVEKAVALYYAVRDGIWYDPYVPFHLPEHYRASSVIERKKGYCVYKASLLCALGRASGIPSRVGFADVRNHLATEQLLEYLGSDLFVFHGYCELFLEGAWVKATPAFNEELCRRHNVAPLEFDGREDSVFQPYDLNANRFMEYVADRGTYADIPVDAIVAGWKEAYGADRVDRWIQLFESADGRSPRDFYSEDVHRPG